MSTLVNALRELWGLFVEDASFTLAILICLGVAGLVMPALGVRTSLRGPLLLLLLALALIENVGRSARR